MMDADEQRAHALFYADLPSPSGAGRTPSILARLLCLIGTALRRRSGKPS